MAQPLRSIIAGGPQSIVRAAGRLIGLEIRRSGPSARDDLRLAHFLRKRRIELVLDVGANRGQFAEQLFAAGYDGTIVSFEALPDAHKALSVAAAKRSPRWIVAPEGALSDKTGTVQFNVNSSDATSSLLDASEESCLTIHGIRPRERISVESRRLDDLAPRYGVDTKRTFVKIDVQGGEAAVLSGAANTLEQIDGLVVELSLTEIYVGQILFQDMLLYLLGHGFEVYDISPAYRDPATFRLKQVDVVLVRPGRQDISTGR